MPTWEKVLLAWFGFSCLVYLSQMSGAKKVPQPDWFELLDDSVYELGYPSKFVDYIQRREFSKPTAYMFYNHCFCFEGNNLHIWSTKDLIKMSRMKKLTVYECSKITSINLVISYDRWRLRIKFASLEDSIFDAPITKERGKKVLSLIHRFASVLEVRVGVPAVVG